MDSQMQALPLFFYVYKITNLKNNKVYIGKTSGQDASERFTNHKHRAFYPSTKNECPKLYRSIRKYGIDSFSFEVLHTVETEDAAYELEAKLVEEYNSIKTGMNTVNGGRGAGPGRANPMFGKGYLISGDKNGMYGRTGETNPFFGKEHTPQFI